MRTLADFDQQQEQTAARSNEQTLKAWMVENFPSVSNEASWRYIRDFIVGGGLELSEGNIQRAIDILSKENPSPLAVKSQADLHKEQEDMANAIVANQYRRALASTRQRGESQYGDFKSSEEGRLKMYEIFKERRHRQLMLTNREVVKQLAAAEPQREAIVQKIMSRCYKAFDPTIVTGSKESYEMHLKDERLMWMEKPIEELLSKSDSIDQSVGVPQRGTGEYEQWKAQKTVELRAEDQQRHPERIGASLPKTFEEARHRSQAILAQHSAGEKFICRYSRRELLKMGRDEFRDLYMMRNPQTGGWVYKTPEIEQAITAVMNGTVVNSDLESIQ